MLTPTFCSKIFPLIINIIMSKIQPQTQQSIFQEYQSAFGCSFTKMKQFSEQLFEKQKRFIGELKENNILTERAGIQLKEMLIQPTKKIKELKQIFGEFGEECKSEWITINKELFTIIKQIVTLYQLKIVSLQSQVLQERSNNQKQKAENQSLQAKCLKYENNQCKQAEKETVQKLIENTISYHKNTLQTGYKEQNIIDYDRRITELFSEEDFTDLFSPSSSHCEIQMGKIENQTNSDVNVLKQKQNTLVIKQNNQENKNKVLKPFCHLLKSKNQIRNNTCNQTFQEDEKAFDFTKQNKKIQKVKHSALSSCKKSINQQNFEPSMSSKFNELRRNLYNRKTTKP